MAKNYRNTWDGDVFYTVATVKHDEGTVGPFICRRDYTGFTLPRDPHTAAELAYGLKVKSVQPQLKTWDYDDLKALVAPVKAGEAEPEGKEFGSLSWTADREKHTARVPIIDVPFGGVASFSAAAKAESALIAEYKKTELKLKAIIAYMDQGMSADEAKAKAEEMSL